MLAERSAQSALRSAARAYGRAIKTAEDKLQRAGDDDAAIMSCKEAVQAAEDASVALERTAVRFAEASPGRRGRRRK